MHCGNILASTYWIPVALAPLSCDNLKCLQTPQLSPGRWLRTSALTCVPEIMSSILSCTAPYCHAPILYHHPEISPRCSLFHQYRKSTRVTCSSTTRKRLFLQVPQSLLSCCGGWDCQGLLGTSLSHSLK